MDELIRELRSLGRGMTRKPDAPRVYRDSGLGQTPVQDFLEEDKADREAALRRQFALAKMLKMTMPPAIGPEQEDPRAIPGIFHPR